MLYVAIGVELEGGEGLILIGREYVRRWHAQILTSYMCGWRKRALGLKICC